MPDMPTSEPPPPLELSQPATIPAPQRQWPAIYALVTSWLLPATSARRTATVSLGWAYGIHLLAGILTVLLVCFLTDIAERDSFGSTFGELLEEFITNPEEATLGTGAVFLFVEIGFLSLALVVLAWGAVDEKLRASWAHALRRVWLLSGHALPIVLLTAIPIITIERVQRQARDVFNPPPPTMPSPPSDPTDEVVMEAYNEAVRQYQADVSAWHTQYVENYEARWRHQPFLVRHGDKLIALVCMLAGTWFLWALYRSAGTRLPTPSIVRPPTCEFCGYNLQATPADSRCPECGELVASSLGPNTRPGTCWEHRGPRSGPRAWGLCALQAVFQPRTLGHSIRVVTAGHAHRRYPLYSLPVIWLAGYFMVLAMYYIDMNKNPFTAEHGTVGWIVAPVVGALSVTFAFQGAMIVGGLIGIIRSLQQKRNLLPAACQMVCYLAGYMIVWSCFAAALAVLAMYMSERDIFQAGKTRWGIDEETLTTVFWVGPQVLWLGGYILLLWRGISGAQYANK